ncbi:hypothetical protein [Congregibacter litoralis]|uniref:Uncharacterized protein n=1 Tax=Congregibacter litoralis KT71 TaxID=314285 RepID=A4A4N3_9GAMM|nr:hypothetical protein [Congregibacter litoralis]EAQ98754.1 hypothetical protein KT71_09012 [Congregibacter litoralis KT71]
MRIFIYLFLLIIASSGNTTEQIDDVFLVGDAHYLIDERPLEQRISRDDLIETLEPEMCTASWRGYRATWTLKDEYLWLSHIQMNPCSKRYESVDAQVLFRLKSYPIKAAWFTGSLVLPVGEKNYIYREGVDPEHYSVGDTLGYDVEAFVFNFEAGKLVSKGLELLEKRYDF